MKLVTVVGARPQFIKAAPVSRALREQGHRELILHTGQHYDRSMSDVFFDELGLATPDVNLGVGSGTHGRQTAEMLVGVERVLQEQRPDWVVVYGDTNSTLAAALAAAKLRSPLAHVEAGLRSYNREMPEEHNRVLTDHCADLLLCPSETAVRNLAEEGIVEGVARVGDPMFDVLRACEDRIDASRGVLDRAGVESGRYAVATLHRAYTADVPERLRRVLRAFGRLEEPVILPLHPRTRRRLDDDDLSEGTSGIPENVSLLEPLGYLDMMALVGHARIVLTDSGGLQKEAFWLGVPCVTLRPETEWRETVESGWNVVTGTDPDRIVEAAVGRGWPSGPRPPVYGEGDAALRIVTALEDAV